MRFRKVTAIIRPDRLGVLDTDKCNETKRCCTETRKV